MTIDRIVLAFAGTVNLIGLALGLYVDSNWYWLSTFVGANLLQSAFTGWCPLAMILKKMGVKTGVAFS